MSSPIDDTEMPGNLMIMISPVAEDEIDFANAQKVCNCVAEGARANWSPERYQELTSELSFYVAEYRARVEETEKFLELGPPRQSTFLQELMKSLAPYVTECEEQIGTRVEY